MPAEGEEILIYLRCDVVNTMDQIEKKRNKVTLIKALFSFVNTKMHVLLVLSYMFRVYIQTPNYSIIANKIIFI